MLTRVLSHIGVTRVGSVVRKMVTAEDGPLVRRAHLDETVTNEDIALKIHM